MGCVPPSWWESLFNTDKEEVLQVFENDDLGKRFHSCAYSGRWQVQGHRLVKSCSFRKVARSIRMSFLFAAHNGTGSICFKTVQ